VSALAAYVRGDEAAFHPVLVRRLGSLKGTQSGKLSETARFSGLGMLNLAIYPRLTLLLA